MYLLPGLARPPSPLPTQGVEMTSEGGHVFLGVLIDYASTRPKKMKHHHQKAACWTRSLWFRVVKARALLTYLGSATACRVRPGSLSDSSPSPQPGQIGVRRSWLTG